MKKYILQAVVSATLLWQQASEACTSFQVQAQDGTRLYCRSMEFGFNLDSDLLIIPRGTTFTGTVPDGKPGAIWTCTYGFLGMNCNLDRMVVTDGMNEKGLVVGELYLPGLAQYQTPDPAQNSKTLGPWELPNYILGTCATVAEVKALLPTLLVAHEPLPNTNGFIVPVHFTVQDAQGGAIVVEYVAGTLHIYDNPVYAMTNAPTFDWHLANLANYVNLTPVNISEVAVGNYKVKSCGQGSGLLGIPGDYTPPSRFVRAALFSNWIDKPKSSTALITLGEHLLNSFDISLGLVREVEITRPEKSEVLELTQWVILHDLTNLVTYFKSYQDQNLKKVDLKKIDFGAKKPQIIKVSYDMKVKDMTSKAIPIPQ